MLAGLLFVEPNDFLESKELYQQVDQSHSADPDKWLSPRLRVSGGSMCRGGCSCCPRPSCW